MKGIGNRQKQIVTAHEDFKKYEQRRKKIVILKDITKRTKKPKTK
jgi:hypothetical protein